jgi:hypothetical protein
MFASDWSFGFNRSRCFEGKDFSLEPRFPSRRISIAVATEVTRWSRVSLWCKVRLLTSAATRATSPTMCSGMFLTRDLPSRISDIVCRIGDPLLRISAGLPGIADPERRIGDPGSGIDDPGDRIGTVSRRIDAGRHRIGARRGRIGERPSSLGAVERLLPGRSCDDLCGSVSESGIWPNRRVLCLESENRESILSSRVKLPTSLTTAMPPCG